MKLIDSNRLKPCQRPRFNSGSMDSALTAAVRVSAFHSGLSCYVYPMAWGYRITWNKRELPFCHPFQEVRATYRPAEKAYAVEIFPGKGGDQ